MSKHFKSRKITCSFCREDGHHIKYCNKLAQNQCKKCNAKGHTSKHCKASHDRIPKRKKIDSGGWSQISRKRGTRSVQPKETKIAGNQCVLQQFMKKQKNSFANTIWPSIPNKNVEPRKKEIVKRVDVILEKQNLNLPFEEALKKLPNFTRRFAVGVNWADACDVIDDELEKNKKKVGKK